MNKKLSKIIGVFALILVMAINIASCAQGNIKKTSAKAPVTKTTLKNTTGGSAATATSDTQALAQTEPQPEDNNSPEPASANDPAPPDPIIPAVAPPIRPINNFDDLRAILAKGDSEINNRFYIKGGMENATMVSSDASADQEKNTGSGNSSDSPSDYSETNVQVDGVDEGDLIKTDGQYIYRINSQKLEIIKAWPVETMSLESWVKFDGEYIRPTDAYVNGNRLAVIGASSRKPYIEQCQNVVRILIYDISNRKNPVLVKDAEIEGYMLSSRRIGNHVYIITNRQVLYRILEKNGELGALPAWRINDGNDFKSPDYSQIGYIPDASANNYMIVASINMMDNIKDIKFSAFLGAGSNIYMSAANLYIAATVNYYENIPQPMDDMAKPSVITIMPIRWYATRTRIYRIPVSGGAIGEAVAGEVRGTIINQFSMDEFEGHFRIGTTDNDWRSNGGNNIFILNMDMKLTGSVEGLAKGERIYSVRFMGKKGYMVTFRTVDPLFAFNLSDPYNPVMTGYLKIPGYSDYLHPYDETHMIGFGKDTVEINGQPYIMGMKLSLFDVSDLANPIEEDKEIIGDRGTDSELLYNHRALLFSKEKKLLAFPVSLYVARPGSVKPGTFPSYGEFKVQGLIVFELDLEKGFVYKGLITHYFMTSTPPPDGYAQHNTARNIVRSVYINDVIYTLSDEIVSANRISDLNELHVLRLQ